MKELIKINLHKVNKVKTEDDVTHLFYWFHNIVRRSPR